MNENGLSMCWGNEVRMSDAVHITSSWWCSRGEEVLSDESIMSPGGLLTTALFATAAHATTG